jgi:hypothetical protein
MSIAEHEQRIRALEVAVDELRSHLPAADADRAQRSNHDVILATEHPLVPGVPPKESKRLRARLTMVERGRCDLALSPTQWNSLHLGEADE